MRVTWNIFKFSLLSWFKTYFCSSKALPCFKSIFVAAANKKRYNRAYAIKITWWSCCCCFVCFCFCLFGGFLLKVSVILTFTLVPLIRLPQPCKDSISPNYAFNMHHYKNKNNWRFLMQKTDLSVLINLRYCRFPEFWGTINDSFSSTCANTYQHSTSYKEISVPMTCLDCKSLLGNTQITEHNTRSIYGRPKLSLIVPRNSGNRANPKNDSP